MYQGIYLVIIRSLCIFVDILTVFTFFNIKYEYNITLRYFHFLYLEKCRSHHILNILYLLKFKHICFFIYLFRLTSTGSIGNLVPQSESSLFLSCVLFNLSNLLNSTTWYQTSNKSPRKVSRNYN